MEVTLSFLPTVSINRGPLQRVEVLLLTPRLNEIFHHVVYPYEITSITLNPPNVDVNVFVDSIENVVPFLQEVSYYLTDAEIMDLGVAPPRDINSIGQDIWAEGDIEIDNQSKAELGLPYDVFVEFIPILVSYRY